MGKYGNDMASQFRRYNDRVEAQQSFAIGFAGGLAAGSVYIAAKRRRQAAVAAAEAAQYRAQENYFSTWLNNTSAGREYAKWEPSAKRLLSQTDARDEAWFDVWERVTPFFQGQVPADEKGRFLRAANPKKGSGLAWAAAAVFAAAVLAAVWFIVGLVGPAPMVTVEFQDGIALVRGEITYEDCLEAVGRADTPQITSKSQCAAGNPVRRNLLRGGTTVVLLGAGGVLLYLRKPVRAKAGREFTTALEEQQRRIARFGYDPLTLGSGQAPFSWADEPEFADRIDAIGSVVQLRFDQPTYLPPVYQPRIIECDERYPVEVNELLGRMAARKSSS